MCPIICPSGATCLLVSCCSMELTLYKFPSEWDCGSSIKQATLSFIIKVTYSVILDPSDIPEPLPHGAKHPPLTRVYLHQHIVPLFAKLFWSGWLRLSSVLINIEKQKTQNTHNSVCWQHSNLRFDSCSNLLQVKLTTLK
jgi:hypothetical protein